jgi:exonuclease VII small subunit
VADDVNDSSSSPINNILSSYDAKIRDIVRRGSVPDRREELLNIKIGQTETAIARLAEQVASRPEVNGQLARAIERREKYEGMLDEYERMRITRTNEQIRRIVSTHMGPTGMRSAIGGMAEDVNGVAMSMANISTSELQRRKAAAASSAGGIYERALGISSEIIGRGGELDEERLAELEGLRSQYVNTIREAATAEAALKMQRRLGRDPQSRYSQASRMAERVDKELMRLEVSEEIKSGHITKESAQEESVRLMKQFAQQMKELNSITDKSGPAFEEMLDNIEKTTEALEKNRESLKQLSSTTNSGITWARGFQLTGQVLHQSAGLVNEILIGHPARRLAAETQAANFINQLFETREAALSGNMAALDLLSSDAIARGIREGAINARTAKTAAAINVGAGVITTAGGAVAAYSGAGAGASVPLIANGVSLTATSVSNLARGVSSLEEANAEYARQMENARAMLHIGSVMRQKAYDFSTSMFLGTQGGGNLFDIFMGAGGQENIEALARMGIAPSELGSRLYTGLNQVSSTFGISNLMQAGAMQRAGIGTINDTLRRQAALSVAGGNPESSLATVLEVAFTNSLEKAKTLNQLVDLTAQSAANTAGAAVGIDVSGTAASTLVRMMAQGANPDAALPAAARMNQTMDSLLFGAGEDYASIFTMQQMAAVGGTDMVTAMAGLNLDPQTRRALLQQLRNYGKMNRKEQAALREQLKELGLGGLVSGDQINTGAAGFLEQSFNKALNQPIFALAGMTGDALKRFQTGTSTEEEANRIATFARAGGMDITRTAIRGALDLSNLSPTGTPVLDSRLAVTGARANVADALAAGGVNEANQIGVVSKAMGDLATFVETAAGAMRALNEQMEGERGARFVTTAVEATENFGKAAQVFTDGLNKMGIKLQELSRIDLSNLSRKR